MDVIKEIYAEVDEENIEAVSNEIDSNIQAIMMDLGNKLTPDLAQEVASVYNLNAKFAFYNVCFSKAFEILQKIDPKISSIFSQIQDVNVQVVSKFTDKLLSLHPTISDLIQRLEEVENERKTGGEGTGDNEGEMAERFRREREEFQREIDELREENMKCMDKIIKQSREIDSLKKGGDVHHDEGNGYLGHEPIASSGKRKRSKSRKTP